MKNLSLAGARSKGLTMPILSLTGGQVINSTVREVQRHVFVLAYLSVFDFSLKMLIYVWPPIQFLEDIGSARDTLICFMYNINHLISEGEKDQYIFSLEQQCIRDWELVW